MGLDDYEWMTPPQVARVIPNTTPQAVRRWAADGQLPGAFRTPSGRWQAVVSNRRNFGLRSPVYSAPFSPTRWGALFV